MEADFGNKSSTLFLSWHNQVYGLSARVILMLLGALEGKLIWRSVRELQCQILDDFFKS